MLFEKMAGSRWPTTDSEDGLMIWGNLALAAFFGGGTGKDCWRRDDFHGRRSPRGESLRGGELRGFAGDLLRFESELFGYGREGRL